MEEQSKLDILNESIEAFNAKYLLPKWVSLLLSALLFILCTVTVRQMWAWFVVPFGVPALSFAHAAGLDALVSFVVTTSMPNSGRTDIEQYSFSFVFAVLTLALGWVFHFFM